MLCMIINLLYFGMNDNEGRSSLSLERSSAHLAHSDDGRLLCNIIS